MVRYKMAKEDRLKWSGLGDGSVEDMSCLCFVRWWRFNWSKVEYGVSISNWKEGNKLTYRA